MTVNLALLRVQATRRIRRTAAVARVRQVQRWLAARMSRNAPAALPRRHRWLRIGSIGSVNGPVGDLVCHDMLGAAHRHHTPALDVVLVPGASTGGPTDLTASVVDALVECERRAIPTVLLVADVPDLAVPVASMCRDVVTDATAVHRVAQAQMGEARAHLLPSAGHGELDAWLAGLLKAVGLVQ